MDALEASVRECEERMGSAEAKLANDRDELEERLARERSTSSFFSSISSAFSSLKVLVTRVSVICPFVLTHSVAHSAIILSFVPLWHFRSWRDCMNPPSGDRCTSLTFRGRWRSLSTLHPCSQLHPQRSSRLIRNEMNARLALAECSEICCDQRHAFRLHSLNSCYGRS
jgi:hypothetical protein